MANYVQQISGFNAEPTVKYVGSAFISAILGISNTKSAISLASYASNNLYIEALSYSVNPPAVKYSNYFNSVGIAINKYNYNLYLESSKSSNNYVNSLISFNDPPTVKYISALITSGMVTFSLGTGTTGSSPTEQIRVQYWSDF